jgi:anti-sigma B factor antagonist
VTQPPHVGRGGHRQTDTPSAHSSGEGIDRGYGELDVSPRRSVSDNGEAAIEPAATTQPPEHPATSSASLPTGFRVDTEKDGSDTWVRVEGELDIFTSPDLMNEIERALATRPERLLIAMTLVSFIDSSAISVLVRAQNEARLKGSRLVVYAPARGVRRTLDLAGLSEHLQIEG